MQVAYAKHLSSPGFATLEYKLGEKSARTVSRTCTPCFVFCLKESKRLYYLCMKVNYHRYPTAVTPVYGSFWKYCWKCLAKIDCIAELIGITQTYCTQNTVLPSRSRVYCNSCISVIHSRNIIWSEESSNLTLSEPKSIHGRPPAWKWCFCLDVLTCHNYETLNKWTGLYLCSLYASSFTNSQFKRSLPWALHK